jgi:hypothetical protein
MIFFRSYVKNFAIAGGTVKSEITRIIPTTLINATTVNAIRKNMKYSMNAVFIPITKENSSSKRKDCHLLKKAKIEIVMKMTKARIINTSNLVTVRMSPKRYDVISGGYPGVI